MGAEAGAWLDTVVVRNGSDALSSLGGRTEDLDSRQTSPMERILPERRRSIGWFPCPVYVHQMRS